MSPPVVLYSALYGVPHKLRTRTPRWLPEFRCRISGRKPTPSGQTPSTKTETVEDEDRLTLGTSELADDDTTE